MKQPLILKSVNNHQNREISSIGTNIEILKHYQNMYQYFGDEAGRHQPQRYSVEAYSWRNSAAYTFAEKSPISKSSHRVNCVSAEVRIWK